VLRAVVLVPLLVLLGAAGAWWFTRGPGVPGSRSAVPQDRPGPVLLVTGFGGDTARLGSLAQQLRRHGRDAEVVPVLGNGTGDLRDQARNLDQAAHEKLVAGAPSVDVIGYSAGGVVVRLWLEEMGGRAHTRRVVTLGSPHHGTRVARLAVALASSYCPTACQQLVPGSDVLRGLPDTPTGPAYTSLWTTDDEIVTPADSARLDGAVNIELQSVCPDLHVQHGPLPNDPLVVGIVERALAVPVLTTPPGPSDCNSLRAAGRP
jgi:pimeloyl-ACP methyl ester carboxylesterase